MLGIFPSSLEFSGELARPITPIFNFHLGLHKTEFERIQFLQTIQAASNSSVNAIGVTSFDSIRLDRAF